MAHTADPNGVGAVPIPLSAGTSVQVRLLPGGRPSACKVLQEAERFISLECPDIFAVGAAVELLTSDSRLLGEVCSVSDAECGCVTVVRVQYRFRRAEKPEPIALRMAAAASAGAGAQRISAASAVPVSFSSGSEQRPSIPPMENNKRVVGRLVDEVWNKRNVAVIDEIIDEQHVNHDPAAPGLGRGPAAYRNVFNLLCIAPDIRFDIEDMVAEGDRVVSRWTATSGYRISLTGITIHRLSHGKIVESWSNWDALGLMNGIARTKGRSAEP